MKFRKPDRGESDEERKKNIWNEMTKRDLFFFLRAQP